MTNLEKLKPARSSRIGNDVKERLEDLKLDCLQVLTTHQCEDVPLTDPDLPGKDCGICELSKILETLIDMALGN